jgi:hypothetical protein
MPTAARLKSLPANTPATAAARIACGRASSRMIGWANALGNSTSLPISTGMLPTGIIQFVETQ